MPRNKIQAAIKGIISHLWAILATYGNFFFAKIVNYCKIYFYKKQNFP